MRTFRVAIASDDSSALVVFRQCLQSAGHVVAIDSRSGKELVQRANAEKPDLIIADLEMLGIEGLHAVKSMLEDSEIPIIIVSGVETDSIIDQASECHVSGFLTKPVRENELLVVIAIAMQHLSEIQSLQAETVSLRKSLDDRKVIERAKGILMRQRSLDEPAAFKRLQMLARGNRQKLVSIAQSIILAGDALGLETVQDEVL
jgi:two-component system, response regulator PdtaR